jgi:hypothetical protein
MPAECICLFCVVSGLNGHYFCVRIYLIRFFRFMVPCIVFYIYIYTRNIQQDAALVSWFYCKITLYVSSTFRTHHQEYNNCSWKPLVQHMLRWIVNKVHDSTYDQCTYVISLYYFRTRNVSSKGLEQIKTHILSSVTFFFFFENGTVYGTWKNIVLPGTPQITIWRMHFACRIPNATSTLSEYVIYIDFRIQKFLQNNATQCYVLRNLPDFFSVTHEY